MTTELPSHDDLLVRFADGHVSRLRVKKGQKLSRILKAKCFKRCLDPTAYEAQDENGNRVEPEKTVDEIGTRRVRFVKAKFFTGEIRGLEKPFYTWKQEISFDILPKSKKKVYLADIFVIIQGPHRTKEFKCLRRIPRSVGTHKVIVIIHGALAKSCPRTLEVDDGKPKIKVGKIKPLPAPPKPGRRPTITVRPDHSSQSEKSLNTPETSLEDLDEEAESQEDKKIASWVQETGYDEDKYLLERYKKGWPDLFIATSFVASKEPEQCGILYRIVKENPDSGTTALHVATHYKNEQVVQFLLAYKANAQAKNKWGDTPLSMAHEMSNDSLIKLFASYNYKLAPKSRKEAKRKSDKSKKRFKSIRGQKLIDI